MIQDAGGVTLTGGARMRTGCVYRISGALADGAELAAVSQAGLRSIVDFRAVQEDRRAVVDWTSANGVAYFNYPIVVGGYRGDHRGALVDAVKTGRHVEFMREAYGELGTRYGREMAAALERVSEGFPSGFGCAAGKDRTGVTGAYLQVLLGADEETAVANYMERAPTLAQLRPAIAQLFELGEDQEIPEPLAYVMSVQAGNLEYAFERVNALGGVEAYLTAHGLSTEAITRLREALVKPAAAPAAG